MDQVKICGRQPLKDFKYFKDCLPQILLAPFLRERERERKREREREKERERERKREREKERKRQRDRERQRERQRETERDRERDRERQREHNLLISDNNSLFLLQINTEYYFQK